MIMKSLYKISPEATKQIKVVLTDLSHVFENGICRALPSLAEKIKFRHCAWYISPIPKF